LALGLLLLVPYTLKLLEMRPDYQVDTYRVGKDEFDRKVNDMINRYTVRRQGDMPIVHPPPDSDVYIPARLYDWGDFIVEIEVGRPYRLHFASMAMKHAVIIRELGIMKRIKPGKARMISITPKVAGTFEMICGDYCGPGHGAMVGRLIVTDVLTEPQAR
jgi:cytochrome c oxidase subunit 2